MTGSLCLWLTNPVNGSVCLCPQPPGSSMAIPIPSFWTRTSRSRWEFDIAIYRAHSRSQTGQSAVQQDQQSLLKLCCVYCLIIASPTLRFCSLCVWTTCYDRMLFQGTPDFFVLFFHSVVCAFRLMSGYWTMVSSVACHITGVILGSVLWVIIAFRQIRKELSRLPVQTTNICT